MRKTKTKQWLTALFAAGALWASAQSCPTNSCSVPSCQYVCNGSFESYSTLPTALSQTTYSKLGGRVVG